MPYRRAHLAVWCLIGLTVVAFWPGYLSRLGKSHWQHHLHALTALAWLLLLITIGVATVLEWIGYHLAPAVPAWAAFGVAVAAAPTWLVGGVGFAIGASAMYLGWMAPLRPRPMARAAA